MKTVTMIKIVLGIAVLATLGLIASGVSGYTLVPEDGSLRIHVLIGLVTVLLLILSHAWLLFFLSGAIWAVRRTLEDRRVEDRSALGAARKLRLSVAPFCLLVLILGVGNFLLGARVFSSSASVALHQGIFFATLVFQLIALYSVGRALGRYDSIVEAVERAAAPAPPEDIEGAI